MNTMRRRDLFAIRYYSPIFLLSFLFGLSLIEVSGFNKPKAIAGARSIEVGPGPNALRVKGDETFSLNCTISNVGSFDRVLQVKWTYESELDEQFKVVTLESDIELDHAGMTTYTFDHHPTSADAGVYNCTFYGLSESKLVPLATATTQLTCDPVPAKGTSTWHGLKEDDPMRRDYKHVPSYTIYPGGAVTLQCSARAYPKPKFKWYRIAKGIEDDDSIGTAPRTEIVDKETRLADENYDNDNFEEEHLVANNDTLIIKNARYEERGYYCCTTNNSDDYSLNLYFLVRVKNPLAALWPLLGIGVVAVLLALIIGVSEHLRRKAEAKSEFGSRPINDKSSINNANDLQMSAIGTDVKLRPNAAKSGKENFKDTKQL